LSYTYQTSKDRANKIAIDYRRNTLENNKYTDVDPNRFYTE